MINDSIFRQRYSRFVAHDSVPHRGSSNAACYPRRCSATAYAFLDPALRTTGSILRTTFDPEVTLLNHGFVRAARQVTSQIISAGSASEAPIYSPASRPETISWRRAGLRRRECGARLRRYRADTPSAAAETGDEDFTTGHKCWRWKPARRSSASLKLKRHSARGFITTRSWPRPACCSSAGSATTLVFPIMWKPVQRDRRIRSTWGGNCRKWLTERIRLRRWQAMLDPLNAEEGDAQHYSAVSMQGTRQLTTRSIWRPVAITAGAGALAACAAEFCAPVAMPIPGPQQIRDEQWDRIYVFLEGAALRLHQKLYSLLR